MYPTAHTHSPSLHRFCGGVQVTLAHSLSLRHPPEPVGNHPCRHLQAPSTGEHPWCLTEHTTPPHTSTGIAYLGTPREDGVSGISQDGGDHELEEGCGKEVGEGLCGDEVRDDSTPRLTQSLPTSHSAAGPWLSDEG
jgi:hypothetical protein